MDLLGAFWGNYLKVASISNKPLAHTADADLSRFNSTNGQNPPCHQNCCNFWIIYEIYIPFFISNASPTIHWGSFNIWVIMCRKNSDPIFVIFSPSLWLQCALLCLPGSLELGCVWTAPQCKLPQVISLSKFKCYYIFRQLIKKNL